MLSAVTKDIEHDVTGRSVILVEDILDTGLTLNFVADRVRAGHPAEVKTCSLLVREGATPSDYMGLWIPRGFVVGYGIDYAEPATRPRTSIGPRHLIPGRRRAQRAGDSGGLHGSERTPIRAPATDAASGGLVMMESPSIHLYDVAHFGHAVSRNGGHVYSTPHGFHLSRMRRHRGR